MSVTQLPVSVSMPIGIWLVILVIIVVAPRSRRRLVDVLLAVVPVNETTER